MKKHTALQTLLLHLLPGFVLLIAGILLLPLSRGLGFHGVEGYFAFNLAFLFVLAPIELGILFISAQKLTKTYKIGSLIPYQEKSKLGEYLIFIIVILLWSLFISGVFSPIENEIRDGLFHFVPDQIAMRNMDLSVLSHNKQIIIVFLSILANGIVAPVTEELYFRGYLLPRINLTPLMSVLVNGVLFSLYHFFSPWYFFSRLLMIIPIYYWMQRKKDIRFSLIPHLIANITTGVSLLFQVI